MCNTKASVMIVRTDYNAIKRVKMQDNG